MILVKILALETNHKGLDPLFTFLKNAAAKTNVRIYGMNTPTFKPYYYCFQYRYILTVSSTAVMLPN